MSWLNLNQSLNTLKGQITNIASEVFSEGTVPEAGDDTSQNNSSVIELEDKCRNLELETASLKKTVEELQATLQTERLSRKNGVKEEDSNWYWDPSPQSMSSKQDLENHYKTQIRDLQEELSSLKKRDTVDFVHDDVLNQLREENVNLKTNLEDLDSQHQQAMNKLLTLKKELQYNFEVLKEEHEELKNSNVEYSNEIKNLLDKIKENDKEILSIKSSKADHDTLFHKYQNLERVHSLLRENAEKFQEENQELHEEVFKLQENVTKLEHDMEIINKHSETSDMVTRQTYDDLLQELNELRERRNSNQVYLDEINIDDNAKSVIDSLRRDIGDLKHKLLLKENQECENNKTVQPEKIMQLYNKYVNFELPIDYVGEMPSTGDNIVLFKVESVFKTAHSFKKEIDSLVHKLSEKNLHTSHLQTQIDDLTTENDFMTTDIQHLERELSEMKKNNDFLISEIAALKNTSKLEPIIETHEDNLAKLETELDDCNKLNKIFESEIKRIQKELQEVVSEKVLLKDNLSDLRHKYTTMLSELELCKKQTKDMEALENKVNMMESETLIKAADETDNLKKRLSVADIKNEQLSIDVHVLENDKLLLSKLIDALQIRLDDKEMAYGLLESLKSTLGNKLQDFEYKLDSVIKHKESLEGEKMSLENKITELITKSNLTHDEIEKASSEKMLLLQKLDTMTKENKTLSEAVHELKTEIEKLQHKEKALLSENSDLKCNVKNENEIKSYHKTIDELRAKLDQQSLLTDEVIILKSEREKLIGDNSVLETELVSIGTKMMHLEAEIEKLKSEINFKETSINSLKTDITEKNITLEESNHTIASLNQTIADMNNSIVNLNHSIDMKNEEIVQLKMMCQEGVQTLQLEKSEVMGTLTRLNDEIQEKINVISMLESRTQELERSCVEYKAKIDNKDKEIKELNQSIVELTDKLKTSENDTHHNDDYAKLVQEKETIVAEMTEMQHKYEEVEKQRTEFKTVIESAIAEKTELINLINLKHNESMQYHNEIQRLNAVILEQRNEFQKVNEDKDKLLQNTLDNCTNCERLRMTIKEKDELIIALNQNGTEYERLKADLTNSSVIMNQLKERCENSDKNLTIQLAAVKTLTAQNEQLSEQSQNLERELERLRHHLVDTEENYTAELMASEHKLSECQARLQQVEERAKQTSTVYTSNSIRANQEVETLRNQIKLMEKQRDDVQAKLSEAEDARNRSEAALTNLQVVLEQFQLDKERDIHTATEKLRNQMQELKNYNNELRSEIKTLKTKLENALAGLQAATRLGDQVETKTAQINDLKEQVRTLQISVAAAEERYYNAINNQQDKVDKNLMKNLVINYVMSAPGNTTNRTQALRVLSTVLDFNQQECERLGLVRSANVTDSLAAEFVKFLQNESRPRAQLPNMMTLGQNTSRSTTPTSRKNSTTIGPLPTATTPMSSHSRNPSTGSNNLLFTNIDSIETSSQRSRDSDRPDPRVVLPVLDTGINQTRNTEGAILKSVLKDM